MIYIFLFLVARNKTSESCAEVAFSCGDFEVTVDNTGKLLVLGSKIIVYGKTLIDLRDGKQNSGTTAQGSKEVRGNGQGTNAGTAKGSGSRDNTLELPVHALFTVTGHNQTLILELLGNIARSGAGNFNPGLGEESAGNKHEGHVDSGVNGVQESLLEVERRRHVVGNTRGGIELSRSLARLPHTQKADQEVVREAGVQHLADQEDVGGQS